MAGQEPFDDLLRALHNAVIEAQKLTEQQHHRQLFRYFNIPKPHMLDKQAREEEAPREEPAAAQDGSPHVINIQVPRVRPDGKLEPTELEVPLMALVPPGAIRIKEMTVGFKIKMLGFVEEHGSHESIAVVEGERTKTSGPLYADVAAGVKPDDPSLASVEMTFEAASPPDAFYRIVESLNVNIR